MQVSGYYNHTLLLKNVFRKQHAEGLRLILETGKSLVQVGNYDLMNSTNGREEKLG